MTNFLLWSFTRWAVLLTVAALGTFGVAMDLLHVEALHEGVREGSVALIAGGMGAEATRIHRHVRKRPAAWWGRLLVVGSLSALGALAVSGLWDRFGVGGIELLCGFSAVLGMTNWRRPPAAEGGHSVGRRQSARRVEAAADGCLDNRRYPKR